MNDLDLVRDLRSDVPSPTRERLAPGRARLLPSISRPSRLRHARRAVLPVTAAAAASAVAVAVASGVLSGPATRSAPVKLTATRQTLTAQLLSTAATTVARRTPAVWLGPHQWFYTKFIGHDYGQPTQSSEKNWETFDGRRTAHFQNGLLIVHKARAAFRRRRPHPHGRVQRQRHTADRVQRAGIAAIESQGIAGSHRQAGGQGRPERGVGKCRLAVRAEGPRRARIRLPGPAAVEFGDG